MRWSKLLLSLYHCQRPIEERYQSAATTCLNALMDPCRGLTRPFSMTHRSHIHFHHLYPYLVENLAILLKMVPHFFLAKVDILRSITRDRHGIVFFLFYSRALDRLYSSLDLLGWHYDPSKTLGYKWNTPPPAKKIQINFSAPGSSNRKTIQLLSHFKNNFYFIFFYYKHTGSRKKMNWHDPSLIWYQSIFFKNFF